MKILVCGGRDFTDYDWLVRVLDAEQPSTIITGMARGADEMAWLYAKARDIPILEFPADWKKYKLAAGPIRNQRMLEEGKPDLVIAFPGGKGTADMVRRAQSAKVKVKRQLAIDQEDLI